ncbi:PASTA domain-containing protein, partial [Frankia sp. AvcI1]
DHTAKSFTMPKDLVGQSEQYARARLQSAGYTGKPTIVSVDAPDMAGRVTKVDPDGGKQVDVDAVVTLSIGKAAGDIAIPADLVGKSQATAEAELRGLGLVPNSVPYANATSHKVGTVDSTDPQVGSAVKPGSTVLLNVVSDNVNVPDVRNRSLDNAVAELGRFGLKAAQQSVANNNVAPGTVVDQQPSGGNVPRGSTVQLSVAAQVQTTPPPSPTQTPPSDQQPTEQPDTASPSPAATQPQPNPSPSRTGLLGAVGANRGSGTGAGPGAGGGGGAGAGAPQNGTGTGTG